MQNSRWMMAVTLGVSLVSVLEGCGGYQGSASGEAPATVATTSSDPASGASSKQSSGDTSDSSGDSSPPAGSSPTFWIPLQESPQSGTAGNNGVYVIPMDALSSTPSALAPPTTNATLLATANETVTGATGAVSSRPAVAMYYAIGPDNNVHIYGINLAAAAKPPTVTQIGSLSLDPASGNHICLADSAQRDQSHPRTLFVVLEITNASGPLACGTGGTFELVNFTDAPSTVPTALPYWSINIRNIYRSNGQLGGLVTFSANSQLVFYSADNLDGAPTVVADKAYAFGAPAQLGDAAYLVVFQDSSSVSSQLYKLTSSGVSSLVYTSQGNLGVYPAVFDSNNLYFTDTQASVLSTIWQISLQSDNAQPLYTVNAWNGASLLESTGSALLFASTGGNGGVTISTLPLNVPSPQPSVLASVPGGYLTSAFLDSSSAHLYINYLTSFTGNVPGTAAFTIATGQQLQGSSNSMFVQAGRDVLLLSGVASSQSLGASTVYRFDPAAATQTPLSLADGSPYKLPQGTSQLTAFSNDGIGAINLQIGTPAAGGPLRAGAVYDGSTNVIVPLAPTNTNVTVW
jgi:hypothetical protein